MVPVKQPPNVANAESKIKEHVNFFKNMHRHKQNEKMFDKQPVIMYKKHPDDYDYDKNIDSDTNPTGDVALRRKQTKS
jgi:hypothetical protein